MPDPNEKSPEEVVRQIRHVTRKKYSAEDKMRIVLEGLRGTTPIQELCRREGIAANLYYTWSKEFIEAGKQRLRGDTERQADTSDVKDLRTEVEQLKQLVAELALENRVLTPALAGGAREKSLLGRDTPWPE